MIEFNEFTEAYKGFLTADEWAGIVDSIKVKDYVSKYFPHIYEIRMDISIFSDLYTNKVYDRQSVYMEGVTVDFNYDGNGGNIIYELEFNHI